MLILLLAGCGPLPGSDQGITDAIVVRNNTTVPVHLSVVLSDGTLFDMHTVVAPGAAFLLHADIPGGKMMPDGCTVGDLIAYDPSGREIARRPPPLCVRKNDVWTIGPAASPAT
jgi:hypothetical protein